MMDTPRRSLSAIPEFDSLEEEAAFWDTHSLAEFEDELEPVEVEVVRPLVHVWEVAVEFDRATFDRLRAVAREQGLTTAELAKAWLLERLDATSAATAAPAAVAATR
jgi:hypothetical protein